MSKFSVFVAIALIPLAFSAPLSKDVEYGYYTFPAAGQHKFAQSFFNIMRERTPGKNLFVSPFSAYNALLLAYLGSEGETMTSLHEVLNFPSTDSKFDVLRKYVEKKEKSLSDQLKSVDKVYVTEKAQLNTKITGPMDDVFEAVDFTDYEARRNEINRFVEEFTENNLKAVLQPGSVTPFTNIILLNAAYFKGAWEQKFDPAQTKTKIFNGVQPANVEMMHIKGKYHTGPIRELSGVKANYLVLPYKNSEDRALHMAMIVFLPKSKSPTAVDDMLDAFTDLTLLSVLEDLEETDRSTVNVELPKMTEEQTSYRLDGVFEQMGVKNLYDTPFEAYSNSANLTIEALEQITKLESDEEGTVAAAVTVSVSRGMSMTEEFHCDHPFSYIIFNDKTNEIVFSGIYRGPN